MTLAIGTTDVDIASNALVLLGQDVINSFSDGTDKAQIFSTVYPTLRDSLLISYPWRFTMAKRQLSRLTATPLNEWKYAFQLPSDRLGGPRAVFYSNAIGATPFTAFEIFEDKLYADEPSIWIDYQYRASEAKFPPHFTQLFIYALAANVADAVTDEQSKADRWHQIAFGTPSDDGKGGYFRTARQIDSQQSATSVFSDFSLIDVRG